MGLFWLIPACWFWLTGGERKQIILINNFPFKDNRHSLVYTTKTKGCVVSSQPLYRSSSTIRCHLPGEADPAVINQPLTGNRLAAAVVCQRAFRGQLSTSTDSSGCWMLHYCCSMAADSISSAQFGLMLTCLLSSQHSHRPHCELTLWFRGS